ncbi:MAG: zinc dependent phospholipase C family protein [Breznakia sp.]
MPAMYAHARFGEEVALLVAPSLQTTIRKYKQEYLLGLQGPDILFFYRPIIKTKVSNLGAVLHKKSAASFIEKHKEMLQFYGKESREYAYFLGFLCHFILDSECHPFIDTMGPKHNLDHLVMESEFEKMLLRKDKYNPYHYAYDTLLRYEKQTLDAIHHFYPELTRLHLQESLSSTRFVKRFLYTPTKRKQTMIKTLMKVSGKYEVFKGQLLDHQDHPKYRTSNFGIYNRYVVAKMAAADLLHNVDGYLKQEQTLDVRFMRTFELEESV